MLTQKQRDALTMMEDEDTVVSPCFEIVIYWNYDGSMKEWAPSLLTLYKNFLERFGKELMWYRSGEMRSEKKCTQKALDIFPHWRQQLEESKITSKVDDFPWLLFHAGHDTLDYQPPVWHMEVYQKQNKPKEDGDSGDGYVQILLNPDAFSTPEAFAAFAKECVSHIPYQKAYAGWALAWDTGVHNEEVSEVAEFVGKGLRRYAGLSSGDPIFCLNDKMTLLPNWLTFLGPDFVERLSNLKKIFVGTEIQIEQVGSGFCLQAGPRPVLGENPKEVTLYHQVGRVLASVRNPEIIGPLGVNGIGEWGLDEEQAEAWMKRFDT